MIETVCVCAYRVFSMNVFTLLSVLLCFDIKQPSIQAVFFLSSILYTQLLLLLFALEFQSIYLFWMELQPRIQIKTKEKKGKKIRNLRDAEKKNTHTHAHTYKATTWNRHMHSTWIILTHGM